jgi:hypothetical protein
MIGLVFMGMGAPIAFPPTLAAMREVAVHDLGFKNDKKLSDSIGNSMTASCFIALILSKLFIGTYGFLDFPTV